ncbi:MAG: SufD family Fe-S cluster assembly protein [Candidatus Pacebacteria bacterium]|jgi:Fe-S cluster assembly protein SufD|nr:SufD family Fe-S cluster assembly protein [Candidatus Paceibacterota bacterium]MBT4652437.1 SufD family Fe-S cluster assembly protein [Candidatus Paceibacterota bacterium]MBT6756264.1 SufD family Fe-S cluster assembly protein [Candidatus Paceibacterota bacterium]MBT6921555.1 SufD family Fe-S cluster assembly protein [Candidatus Paceibacterota bacterium]
MKIYTIKKDQHEKIKLTKSGSYLIELTGAGSSVDITGVFKAEEKNKLEIYVVIHHKAPHTKAETVLKGVVRDSSFLQLKGKIIIDENCGDSSSFLTERVLLLSDKAKAEAIPDLEIKTDDVQCSHAASISSISEEHLFYLETRGIGREKAEEMVVDGFLNL